MIKGVRFLPVLVLFLVFISFALVFYRYEWKKDFLLFVKDSCDPAKESCFVETCAEDDSRCLHFAENDTKDRYYKVIYVKASALPSCHPNDEKCIDVFCAGNSSCSIVNCSDESRAAEQISDACSEKQTPIL